MINEKCIVLIPARMESSRLPGKALKEIGGIPMVVHVAIRSSQCPTTDRTIVCTDSADIIFECEKYGIEACNTKGNHLNGTERIAEAAILLNLPDDQIVIDVQGDEPFVSPKYISKVANFISQSKYDCVVPYQDFEEPDNTNRVKIVSSSDRIIYFSRSDVPNYFGQISQPMKKHLSIIGFRVAALKKYISGVPTELEKLEKIELFRLIENNIAIGTFKMDGQSISVDTEEDYHKACRMIETDSYFLKLLKKGFFNAEN